MSLNCGIIGLPNVGKSTIFQALTAAPAEIANYPFCTIDPNVGIVNVYDARLDQVAKVIGSEKTVYATVELVDIAGLVAGASKGEGLGNQFLGHIRQVNAIVHVVRCFEDENVTHVTGKINPVADIDIVNLELVMADLEMVERRLNNIDKYLKSSDKELVKKTKISIPILEQVKEELSKGISVKSMKLNSDELEVVDDLDLLTNKKVLYLCNIDENSLGQENHFVTQVKNIAQKNNDEVLSICGKLEAEILTLDDQNEKEEFLQSLNIQESGIKQLIKASYKLLELNTFFTANKNEARAWTFHQGIKALKGAGLVHSDFEKGFIKAVVYNYNELVEFGSEAKLKEHGKLRIVGKDYLIHDGDIILFRFNL